MTPECPEGARLLALAPHAVHGQRYAVVDAADFDDLSAFRWHVHGRPTGRTLYARRVERRPGGGFRSELMHRRLLPGADCVDHINGEGLDNRRCNLRSATALENARNLRGPRSDNTSGFLGVYWHPQARKWRAAVRCEGRIHSAGLYATREEAARARDQKAVELHGDFASLNFPEETA